MELELRWTPNRGQDKFIADDVHTHVHGAAMGCGLWTVKFWMSRDRYRELIIVGDLNIIHETSAKILQNLEGEDVRMCHFSQSDVTVV